jgi:N-methylhydantoinase A
VTDAMVLLGYMDPDKFMGCAMELDVEAARAACAALGRKIGLDSQETAFGIRTIALAEMGKALRARLANGGLDPRKFFLVAFGGSGSLFATELAKDLDMPSVMTPAFASVLSAFGAAIADVRVERALSLNLLLPLSPGQEAEFYKSLDELRASVENDLRTRDIAPAERTYLVELDVRISRQMDYVTLVFTQQLGILDNLAEQFRSKYINRYGKAGLMANFDIELSTLRILGIGRTVRATLPTDEEIVGTAAAPVKGHRKVLVQRGREIDVPVYEADELRRGEYILGPALIDAPDTTLWAPPASRVVLTRERSLVTSFNSGSNAGE